MRNQSKYVTPSVYLWIDIARHWSTEADLIPNNDATTLSLPCSWLTLSLCQAAQLMGGSTHPQRAPQNQRPGNSRPSSNSISSTATSTTLASQSSKPLPPDPQSRLSRNDHRPYAAAPTNAPGLGYNTNPNQNQNRFNSPPPPQNYGFGPRPAQPANRPTPVSRPPRTPQPPSTPLSDDPSELFPLFRAANASRSGTLSESELGSALVNGDYTSFDPYTVKTMINMFDKDGSGTVGFDEFVSLWRFLAAWRELFERFDEDRSGRISLQEFSNALLAFGYRLSQPFVGVIFSTFESRGRKTPGPGMQNYGMSFDLFVQACVSLKRMTDVFKRYDEDRDGYVTLSFEEFLSGKWKPYILFPPSYVKLTISPSSRNLTTTRMKIKIPLLEEPTSYCTYHGMAGFYISLRIL